MGEGKIVSNTTYPRTRASLASDLQQIGLEPGVHVLVHSSLSSLGWVNGGAVAVIQALMDVLTLSGTLIMPTHTGDYSDPGQWGNPPVPKSWLDLIKKTMPAFEPEITPTRGMGIIPETFRKWPGTIRSNHPSNSFAAWGKYAEYITHGQSLDFSLGEHSPLGHLYNLDGYVLLLGVGFENNTSFHLAEYRSGRRFLAQQGAPILKDGQRIWATYQDLDFETDLFTEMGTDFIRTTEVVQGQVGSAKAFLFKQRQAVDFAVEWIRQQ